MPLGCLSGRSCFVSDCYLDACHSSEVRWCGLQAVESLEGVRLLVQDKLGSSSLLAERPGKRMAKHKSRAVSSSFAQRYCLVLHMSALACCVIAVLLGFLCTNTCMCRSSVNV